MAMSGQQGLAQTEAMMKPRGQIAQSPNNRASWNIMDDPGYKPWGGNGDPSRPIGRVGEDVWAGPAPAPQANAGGFMEGLAGFAKTLLGKDSKPKAVGAGKKPTLAQPKTPKDEWRAPMLLPNQMSPAGTDAMDAWFKVKNGGAGQELTDANTLLNQYALSQLGGDSITMDMGDPALTYAPTPKVQQPRSAPGVAPTALGPAPGVMVPNSVMSQPVMTGLAYLLSSLNKGGSSNRKAPTSQKPPMGMLDSWLLNGKL